jgi:predicted membrane protein
MPVDIVSRLGVGETRMDLGTIRLRSLRVDVGVGSLRLDLRGTLRSDCDVQIHGGVGEATVLLPKTAGISATAKGGIGDISVEGLEKRDGRWINAARDPKAPSIHIEIEGGVGNIRLVAE